jgi:hypothetical protein
MSQNATLPADAMYSKGRQKTANMYAWVQWRERVNSLARIHGFSHLVAQPPKAAHVASLVGHTCSWLVMVWPRTTIGGLAAFCHTRKLPKKANASAKRRNGLRKLQDVDETSRKKESAKKVLI